MNFYQRYSSIRDRKGLTDYKVSQLTGLAPSTISEWKTENATPKTDSVVALAGALGVTTDDLLRDVET